MFYSQFILAKKGPLGTIWIAAHLERKLRKNQVADTDIGVSVDSILFPEAPIALRLSSHLLLGVVRIYSRKVSYLFDDCSEALLKIKQAFRSTAVDLPPEESKAPYHSITLPETFDLDDFELPDNDIFHGNYVDHHISAREQITLQDNMEGVVFSTSQFGLDERFGDGDTSGLDLDEELFLGKVDASVLPGIRADLQASVQPTMPLKQDEDDEGMLANPETRNEVANVDADLMDYAQAPCTPGLVEEPNLSNVQETSACDDHLESKYNNLMKSAVKENLQNFSGKSNLQGNAHLVDWSVPDDTNSDVVHVPCEENGYHSGDRGNRRPSPEVIVERASLDDPTSMSGASFVLAGEFPVVCEELNLTDKILTKSDRLDSIEELQNGILKIDGVDGPSVDLSREDHADCNGIRSKESAEETSYFARPGQQVPEDITINNQTSDIVEESNNVEVPGNSERPFFPGGAVELRTELKNTSSLEKPENKVDLETTDSCVLVAHDETQHTEVHILRPCDAGLGQLNPSHAGVEYSNNLDTASSFGAIRQDICEAREINHAFGLGTLVQGEQCDAVDESKQILEENHAREPALLEEFHIDSGKSDNQINVGFGGESLQGNLNSSAINDFPAPEKLLSAPEGHFDQPRNLLVDATPGDLAGLDESDAGSRFISGKKRSYTESTLTEQSLNSVESLRVVRTKKTVEAIPDDDDLLSSILVGRKSSLLKVKPSPPPCEITSLKRHRSAPRSSASKKRVHLDDTMVLHGDTIRQQLTNTEDIRRLRKKAPCTWPEISMIQKQFLEDEIFNEAICSGVSTQLASLHNQTYDLSGIVVSQADVNGSTLLSGNDMNVTSRNDEKVSNFGVKNVTCSASPDIAVEKDKEGIGELAVLDENHGVKACETHVLVENTPEEGHDCSIGTSITQVQVKPTEDDGAEAAVLGSSQLENLQNSAGHIYGGSRSRAEAGNPANPVEIEPSDRASGDVVDILVDTVQRTSLEQSSMDAAAVPSDMKREREDVEVDASMMNGSKTTVDYEKDDPVNGDNGSATVETARDINDQAVESNTRGPPVEIEPDLGRVEYNDQLCDGTYCEEPIISSFHPLESTNNQNTFIYNGEYPMQREAYTANIVDAEISGIDMHAHDDLNYSAAANETEFLNFDDDEVDEVMDDHIPRAEEIRVAESSGWSSRTRAVAKYLQLLFIKEAESGRRALPMDNLLTGKTRKEASRMFFESLVLKTRDYIHVEQEHPFDNIAIKPRTKLKESDF